MGGWVMRTLTLAVTMAVALVACGGGDERGIDEGAATRACHGLAGVVEATKIGDEQAIRDGFRDVLSAANEIGDDELTSLVVELRAADGDAAFVDTLLDLSEYCEQLDA
jgi:hypothetical protein